MLSHRQDGSALEKLDQDLEALSVQHEADYQAYLRKVLALETIRVETDPLTGIPASAAETSLTANEDYLNRKRELEHAD